MYFYASYFAFLMGGVKKIIILHNLKLPMQYQKLSDILSKMLLAVALSDNVILHNEINYILQKGGSEILSQKINFTIPEASKNNYKSSVQLVGKSIENKDRTISVFGVLDPVDKAKLLSGMFVEAGIVTHSKKGLAIPKDALITENEKNFILLLKEQKGNYTFKKTLVTIGETSEQFVEIIPNEIINENSKILTKGVFDLTN